MTVRLHPTQCAGTLVVVSVESVVRSYPAIDEGVEFLECLSKVDELLVFI